MSYDPPTLYILVIAYQEPSARPVMRDRNADPIGVADRTDLRQGSEVDSEWASGQEEKLMATVGQTTTTPLRHTAFSGFRRSGHHRGQGAGRSAAPSSIALQCLPARSGVRCCSSPSYEPGGSGPPASLIRSIMTTTAYTQNAGNHPPQNQVLRPSWPRNSHTPSGSLRVAGKAPVQRPSASQ